MDPIRTAHPPQAPAESSAFAPGTTSLNPATSLATSLDSRSPKPSNIHPEHTTQQSIPPFTAPIQATGPCAAQPAGSQMQPLSQALHDPFYDTGMPATAQRLNPEAIPRSEVGSAAQQIASLYPHQVDGLGGPTATAPFLQDFNLVAEAAKRAQMSIVMRDLESVTL